MSNDMQRRIPVIAAIALAGLSLAGCSAGASKGETPDGIPHAQISGEVRVDGSSTVFPISEAMAEEFSIVARKVRVNVGFSGTGGGFEKFCRGEIDIADASRKVKPEETEKCRTAGITDVLEVPVAIDALTVAVHQDNSWLRCITPEQLQRLFKDGGPDRWNEVDPSWPDSRIRFYYPGTDSGTFDYFKETIIEGYGGKAAGLKHRGDGTASEDDNILLRAVRNDKNAIGYFGFAYFSEAGEGLRAVEINDKGKGCVGPTAATAIAGTYTPLSRPLLLYTRESFVRDRDELYAFLAFYLAFVEELVPQVGYINQPDASIETSLARLAAIRAD